MQSSTGLGKKHSPLFSSALQNRPTAGLCHCNYAYGQLLCIQVCSEPTGMHCSTGLGKMHSLLFSSALHIRLTAGLCHCTQTNEDLLFSVSQQKCTAALVWANSIPYCSEVLCKTGSQQACVNAITPVERCFAYRYAVSQQKCTAALVWAKCIPHCSEVLCKSGSQQACVTAIKDMEICSCYRCAVSQQKCSLALVWAKTQIPHCSVALCIPGVWKFAGPADAVFVRLGVATYALHILMQLR